MTLLYESVYIALFPDVWYECVIPRPRILDSVIWDRYQRGFYVYFLLRILREFGSFYFISVFFFLYSVYTTVKIQIFTYYGFYFFDFFLFFLFLRFLYHLQKRVDKKVKIFFGFTFFIYVLPTMFDYLKLSRFPWSEMPTDMWSRWDLLNDFYYFFILYFRSLWDSLNNLCYVHADVPVPYQLGFQDPATEFVEGIIDLHHDVFGYIVFISIFVFYMLSATVFIFRAHYNIRPPVDIRHHTMIEVIWTIVPTIVIIAIAVPSFILIYAMDELVGPQITIKAVGNQWYWNYEYTDMSMRAPAKGLPNSSFLFGKYSSELYRHDVFMILNSFAQRRSNFSFILASAYRFDKKALLENFIPSLYWLELYLCSLYLNSRFNFEDSYFPLDLSNFFLLSKSYFYKWNSGYFSISHLLYLFNRSRFIAQHTLLDQFVDYGRFGNFSNKVFSLFLKDKTSFFFSLTVNGHSVFLQPSPAVSSFWEKVYVFLYKNFPYTNLNPVFSYGVMFSFFQKYNWLQALVSVPINVPFETIFLTSLQQVLQNMHSSRTFFSSYCWTFFQELFNKKSISVSDSLAMFSFRNSVKIPFSLKIESRMLDTDIVEKSWGQKFRLLSVDCPVIMPTETQIRFLTTANDVLHSWTIPSFGVKIDACPGRLNQVGLYIKREGVFYGQCSEICGVNHGFMPIEVRAYTSKDFLFWVTQNFYKGVSKT